MAKISGKAKELAESCQKKTYAVPTVAVAMAPSSKRLKTAVDHEVVVGELARAKTEIKSLKGTAHGAAAKPKKIVDAADTKWGEHQGLTADKVWKYGNQKTNALAEIRRLIKFHCTRKDADTADPQRRSSVLTALNDEYCAENPTSSGVDILPKAVQHDIMVDRFIVDRVRDGLQA